MQYSVESTILPVSAPELLEWAAAHVEARGFHDGRDGSQFGPHGTTTRLLTPGILGALDVAGGDGRMSSSRRYDYDAIEAARRLALDVLSDLLSGGAVVHDTAWGSEERHRRAVVHRWGMEEGRTAAEVAGAFREAAVLAGRAHAAVQRLGVRACERTPAGVLEWAAIRVETVGHRPGEESHDPAGYVDTAPCTMLHALERAVRAVKPLPSERNPEWGAYREASDAVRLMAEYLAGGPVAPDGGPLEVDAQRRAVILAWGNRAGRTTEEVAAAFRAAAPGPAGLEMVPSVTFPVAVGALF
ncbi:hypothetical protein EV284_6387 [Streptomyces sp. BK022]|uniref:DUF6197 family protein n=1 Tax=Streptomyces sp. BK022 TaxID=2512123 RepID=UPI001029927D|nr:DUF6197 family protein [Streptomyces sp. BK022]RZU28221.1 hypothetical protein EV284_6387 [Streptomyces sp. BK022]